MMVLCWMVQPRKPSAVTGRKQAWRASTGAPRSFGEIPSQIASSRVIPAARACASSAGQATVPFKSLACDEIICNGLAYLGHGAAKRRRRGRHGHFIPMLKSEFDVRESALQTRRANQPADEGCNRCFQGRVFPLSNLRAPISRASRVSLVFFPISRALGGTSFFPWLVADRARPG